jgi:predicted RNA-binding Zn-ribbon protein involved in translation (DUF1610 family)
MTKPIYEMECVECEMALCFQPYQSEGNAEVFTCPNCGHAIKLIYRNMEGGR